VTSNSHDERANKKHKNPENTAYDELKLKVDLINFVEKLAEDF
jgi:hypothetical protein